MDLNITEVIDLKKVTKLKKMGNFDVLLQGLFLQERYTLSLHTCDFSVLQIYGN